MELEGTRCYVLLEYYKKESLVRLGAVGTLLKGKERDVMC
jgi:hypothetical protein